MDVANGTMTQPLPEKQSRGLELAFPHGLPGFPGARRFTLAALEGAPGFFELRSLEDPALAFVLAASGDGFLPLCGEDLGETCRIAGFDPRAVAVFFVVTLVRDGGGSRAYVNMRAPLLVDTQSRTAAQVVLADPGYPLRFPLPRRAA